MNLKQIENQALDLSEEERAQLAQKLILSLESSNDEDLDKEWLLEAKRRAVELDNGEVQPIPAEEVRKKAQALLR
jgi:putative addiction module component (TIGR02574 family)